MGMGGRREDVKRISRAMREIRLYIRGRNLSSTQYGISRAVRYTGIYIYITPFVRVCLISTMHQLYSSLAVDNESKMKQNLVINF